MPRTAEAEWAFLEAHALGLRTRIALELARVTANGVFYRSQSQSIEDALYRLKRNLLQADHPLMSIAHV